MSGFHTPGVLWLLTAAPLLLIWALVERRTRAVLRFSATGMVAAQGRGVRPFLLPLLPVLRAAAIACAVIALARPQQLDAAQGPVDGIDIMIALDLSSSMETANLRAQNRLAVARDVLARASSRSA